MGMMDRIEHGFSSLIGNLLSLGTGHGIDQGENYYRPDAGQQKPDIHINADSLDLHAANVNIMEQAPEPAREPAAPIEPAPDINARDWNIETTPPQAAPVYDREAREAAFNRTMQDQDDGLTLGR